MCLPHRRLQIKYFPQLLHELHKEGQHLVLQLLPSCDETRRPLFFFAAVRSRTVRDDCSSYGSPKYLSFFFFFFFFLKNMSTVFIIFFVVCYENYLRIVYLGVFLFADHNFHYRIENRMPRNIYLGLLFFCILRNSFV